MSDLTIKTEIIDGHLTMVRLSGLFEGMAAIESEPKLMDILKKVKTPLLWLDFSGIAYVDSSAIGVLINLTRAAVAQKVQFSLCKPNENVRKVLSMTHVDRLIPIVEG